ncbi:hypothetical protein SSX86_023258 [Deinandra increscens subsp. villosa]|uniref:Caleosin n=1 Tax=Deinandra increscens subsp. villosa TaxID=3103831 RepID=A0AAP0CLZ5_9ASTR
MEIGEDPVALVIVAPMAPVMSERAVRTDLESSISKPYMARAMATPDMEHPDGTLDHEARGLSVLQQHGYIPSLLLPVYIDNIHKGKHPSDSGTYDTKGRYMPVNFENMFSKFGKTSQDKLTLRELWNMTEGNRVAWDGLILNKLEWGVVYIISRDDEGYLSKEVIRGVFDGSLFDNLSRKNSSKGKKMM